jgi:hypothetical protein
MLPGVRRFVSLPGFEARDASARLLGDVLLVAAGERLIALDLRAATLVWERRWPQPAPIHYQVPRRPHVWGQRIWARDETVASLVETEDGVAVVGCETAAGRERWRTDIATPPPTAWTESSPAWPGAPTEEITAMLFLTDELLVGFARTSRRSMLYPGPPAPPFRAQLDVHTIDPEDGRVRAVGVNPDVHVPILEKSRLGRWLLSGKRLLRLDPGSTQARVVAHLPHEPCWPEARGEQVLVCWRARGALAVALVDGETGEVRRESSWKRKAATAVKLHAMGDLVALQINEQFLAPLGDDLGPRWEARVKPYIYGVAAPAGGSLFVATAGNGGGLYCFSRDSSEPLMNARFEGGAWDLMAVPGTDRVAAACGRGLVVAEGRARQPEVFDIAGASALVPAGQRRVALLCGEPAPGIHLVDVD